MPFLQKLKVDQHREDGEGEVVPGCVHTAHGEKFVEGDRGGLNRNIIPVNFYHFLFIKFEINKRLLGVS